VQETAEGSSLDRPERRPKITEKDRPNQNKLLSINPATLEPVGEVSLASYQECENAIKEAARAFPQWRDLALEKKQDIFRRARQILLERGSDIARLITAEKGSPLPESLSVEVWGALAALDYYSRSLKKSLRKKPARHHVPVFLHKKAAFLFQPLGPTLIISPWNFPFLIAFCDILSALSAGNTVILRPSTSTSLVGLSIKEIFVQAGLPPGVLNIVICRVPQAEEMITHPIIQTIMFTGSTSTGKRIMELASRNLTNIVLELGGKDPMIVLQDADLERASQGAVWAAFMNCGQSCGAVERVYVADEIAQAFMERVLDITSRLKVGNPLDPEIDIGPLATQSQLAVVEEHVEEARRKGARILYGGQKITALPGYFYQPTVLKGVDHSMKIMREETFGPVLPIMRFSDPEEAVSLANDSIYGLSASVWTKNRKKASWMAERLETGTVTINDHMFSFEDPAAIWGGIKQTGIGHSHGRYGLLDLVNIKFTSYDYLKNRALLWWFPYEKAFPRIMDRSLTYFYHRRFGEKIKALFSLLPYLGKIRKGIPFRNFIKGFPRLFRK
jgi:succinate-semialdehyde dehydrogenase/glutarate-semialdehyde dehydrogenase